MSFNNLESLYRQVIMDHYKNPRNRGVIEGDALTVDMNNPTCGDRIQLQLQIEDGVVKDAKFEGEGCSISMSSASMMTQAIKGQPVADALEMSKLFSNMMLGGEIDTDLDMGDAEALSGVSQFPARIKCATLAWKAMEKGVHNK
ncbi:Fe-S cluster assembly sulfur transfer protein SufU [Ornithinibacillus halotolerans]|uniref:Iron-sulfur cluster assembly scaffold protein NifU n=1 Tax=Ornithinibacillus halotolerans TaxID=1274357 RepID=A0A916RZA7_9BACI|nr:SUF system NifU family Fe-S cluster assembly protein [Ornithinibacillus halotolerans]GGA76831.1 iron-sulfur cluster assembly scaffold protein NifU [Ornithinibacillus halotolerans]